MAVKWTRFNAPSRSAALARAAVAIVVLMLWLGVMGAGGPIFGKIGEVQSTDQTTFLPSQAEATQAVAWQNRFADSKTIPALVVIEAREAITPETGMPLRAALSGSGLVQGQIVGPIRSDDGLALEMIVPLRAGENVSKDVEQVRALTARAAGLPPGTTVHVTGPAGFSADLKEAFSGIDGLLLGVALLAVLLILLVVYRSVLLPLFVLLTAIAALCAAIAAVYAMAKIGWIRLDGQSQGILSILVIGAATDYCLLLVARFREALGTGAERGAAVVAAMRRSWEPIIASAGTVTVGLLCLLFSDLNSNKALGPIAAGGIVFSVIAALTLLPALLLLTGRAAFWPFLPKTRPAGADELSEHGVWSRIALWVQRHHRPIWIVTALVLAVGCAGVAGLKASGVPESELVLGQTDSKEGRSAIARHFYGGAGSPTVIYPSSGKAVQVADAVGKVNGVGNVSVTGTDGGPVRPGIAPKEIDGRVQVNATLSAPADSVEAQQTLHRIRDAAHAVEPTALVGGPTATAVDKQETAVRDLTTIIPIVLLAILAILVLLLRSLVAPVVLVLTTALSYGTAMGVSALVFNHIFRFPGADPSVPLFGFVFLVALGVDYNIFLMSRVREEVRDRGPREGLTYGLAVTGGVITSAGLVLAATFAALGVIPIMFLIQLGFIVAFGVLLDTFVVRTLLVPALGHDLGRRLWWPSALSRGARPDEAAT